MEMLITVAIPGRISRNGSAAQAAGRHRNTTPSVLKKESIKEM